MAKAFKFVGPDFIKQVKKALDNGTAQLLTNTQSKLSDSSPVNTGRLASSFNIGHNSPDLSVAPERTQPGIREGGSATIEIKQYSGKITFDGDWYLSNNLPYATRAAMDPGYVGRRGGGSGDWYSQIVNQLPNDTVRIFAREFRKIK